MNHGWSKDFFLWSLYAYELSIIAVRRRHFIQRIV